MNSTTLKNEALCWLRFSKQMQYVCTEGGYWSADVLGANSEFVIEVEVKVSIADLQAEFRNKKSKHAYYTKGLPKWSPNYFYFLVPPEIADKAKAFVKEKFPKAGVLVYSDTLGRSRPGERLSVTKRPVALHTQKPHGPFIESMRRRMGSELCGLRIAMDKLKVAEIGQLEELRKEIVDSIIASHGAEDWETLDDQRSTTEDSVRGGDGSTPDPSGD